MEELLDECLARDPRHVEKPGAGCDNMTCVVIDLRRPSHTRAALMLLAPIPQRCVRSLKRMKPFVANNPQEDKAGPLVLVGFQQLMSS